MNLYLLFKSLHLIAVVSWMAGLLYLPRIFVYHVENKDKKIAMNNGCKQYTRIPALGTNEDFIKSMSELIIKKDEYKFSDYLCPPEIKCPSHLKKCPCLNYE